MITNINHNNEKKCVVFDFDCTLTKTQFYYFVSEFNRYKEMYLSQSSNQSINKQLINLQKAINQNIWNKKRTEIIDFELNSAQKELFINQIFGSATRVEYLKKYFDEFIKNGIDIHISTRGYYGHVNWCLKTIGLDTYIKHINSMSGTRIFDGSKFIFYNSGRINDDEKHLLIDHDSKLYTLEYQNVDNDAYYYKHDFMADYIIDKYFIVIYVDDSALYYNLLTKNHCVISEKDLGKIRDVQYFGVEHDHGHDHDQKHCNQYDQYTIIHYRKCSKCNKFIFITIPEDYGGGLNMQDSGIYSLENRYTSIDVVRSLLFDDNDDNDNDHISRLSLQKNI